MSEKIKKVKVQSGQLALDSFLAKTVPSMSTLRITVREMEKIYEALLLE